MAYVDLVTLKIHLGITSDTDDVLLQAACDAVQDAIDHYCDMPFESVSETRYFKADALGPEPGQARVSGTTTTLYLDKPLLTCTTLTNGDTAGTVIASGHYTLLPRNESPKWFILPKSDHSWSFGTDGEISVLGTWGYSATAPDDIQWAAREWAAFLYRNKDAQVFNAVGTPEIGTMVVNKGIPTHVWQILERYRRRSVA